MTEVICQGEVRSARASGAQRKRALLRSRGCGDAQRTAPRLNDSALKRPLATLGDRSTPFGSSFHFQLRARPRRQQARKVGTTTTLCTGLT